MADIILNPDIANLETDPELKHRKDIYDELLQGMVDANKIMPPDYSVAPYATQQIDSDGNPIFWEDPEGNKIPLMKPNQSLIEKKMAELSTIQMKNAAYLFAKVMDDAATSAATGIDVTTFIQKSGDVMTGMFTALKGFQAGYDGTKILDVSKDSEGCSIAHVYGQLIVDEDATFEGKINMSGEGVYFKGTQCLFYKDGVLNISNHQMQLTGDITVDGFFALGQVLIDNTGIHWGSYDFYHSGNCNNSTTDWSMMDAHVYRDLIVDGFATYNGRLKALNGFDLGEKNNAIFSSIYDDAAQKAYILLSADIDIQEGCGVTIGGDYIIKAWPAKENAVSFSAPGRILNLGDSSGEKPNAKCTQYISLKSNIYRSVHVAGDGMKPIISHDGEGCFTNGFSAGVSNIGPCAMRTYSQSSDDYGVIFQRMLAFGDKNGPKLRSEDANTSVKLNIPYIHTANGGQVMEHLDLTFNYGASNSLWHVPIDNPENDVSLHIDTDGEFFIFNKPIEAITFSINSQKYKTQLKENALFLRESIFIEGVTEGMAFTGNSYFNNNIQSLRFASGFAGYGWGVVKSEYAGGYHATFDELTVRKKMRIYELEVQKIGAANGSLWISDSCSGDLVEEISEAIF